MSMNSDDWRKLGGAVAGNLKQTSTVEGGIGVVAATAIASGQPEAQIGGLALTCLWSLWKMLFNHNK